MWLFEAIRYLYFVQIILSVIFISLLSALTILTNTSSSINLPSDVYASFIFSSLSLLISVILSIPSNTRRFGYTLRVLIINLILAISWFTIAIIVVAKANNGSVIDPSSVINISLGCAIGVFDWINVVSWTASTILYFKIRSSVWTKKSIDKRIIIQNTNYSRSSFHYDQDAKVLTTPKIIKGIDELIKGPEATQQSNQTSVTIEKLPISELDYSLSNTNTTTYTLVNTSSTERSFVPATLVVSNDYYTTPTNEKKF